MPRSIKPWRAPLSRSHRLQSAVQACQSGSSGATIVTAMSIALWSLVAPVPVWPQKVYAMPSAIAAKKTDRSDTTRVFRELTKCAAFSMVALSPA